MTCLKQIDKKYMGYINNIVFYFIKIFVIIILDKIGGAYYGH